MDSNHITLPPETIKKCWNFARDIVAQYERGQSPNSLAYSSHGAERNIRLQAQAKGAECAFASWLGGDIDRLHWDDGADLGFDLAEREFQFDVKQSGPCSRWLIWPVNKNVIFQAKRFNALALMLGEMPEFNFTGWIEKRRFFEQKSVAGCGHKLTEGTWYLDRDSAEVCWAVDDDAVQ
jgi:hypothetical protein